MLKFKDIYSKEEALSVLFISTANEHILTEFWLQIVEVAITSVGMSVQWLTYWLCSLFYHLVMNVLYSLFNTRAFTVASIYYS
jgi:hypothetical protein